MTELTIATCRGLPGLFHDDQWLPEAFARHEITVRPVPWQDIEACLDPVLVRTPWDYTDDVAAFEAWLRGLEAAGTPCINPPDLMLWNLDKRYLLEMAAAGHDIVPTVVIDGFDAEAADEAAAGASWAAGAEGAGSSADGAADEGRWAGAGTEHRGRPDAVAKPVRGAGAEGLLVRQDGAWRGLDTSGNVWAANKDAVKPGPYLIQPYLPEIAQGEWSLFFFGGAYSHAILKRPAVGDLRVQEEHGGSTVPARPDPATIQAAHASAAFRPATYARVDGVIVDGRFRLMELELIEPELYFRYADSAETAFAQAVATTLRHETYHK